MYIHYFFMYPTSSQNEYGNKFITEFKARQIGSKKVTDITKKRVSADNLNRQQKLFFETRWFVTP